jgi:hypothetical protein
MKAGMVFMADTNLVSLGKVTAISIPNRRRTDKSDLHLQLRNEIDKLAIFIRDLKAHADRVQKAADALGDELLLNDPDRPTSTSYRNARFPG